MSRRVSRVNYELDSKNIKTLSSEDIGAIIRGADDLIMSGGRNMLAKILKGSKTKRLLELKLSESPVYGYYAHLKSEDILARIDWCIENDYFEIRYNYRLPLLAYTQKGWAIEKDIYSDELVQKLNEICFSKDYSFVNELKDRNRELIWLLLDKIKDFNRKQYIPVLKEWEKIDYKKVRQKIRWVINELEKNSRK